MSAPPLSAVLLFLCLPSAAADEAVIIERLYTGGSCSGGPAEEVTYPSSGRCTNAFGMSYRNAWWEWPSPPLGPTTGSDPLYTYSSGFQVGTELQYCWGTTQASCDAATKSVINSGDDQVSTGPHWSDLGSRMPPLVYPDTANATCGAYISVMFVVGTLQNPGCISGGPADYCTLSGCRLQLIVSTAPSPPPIEFLTEALYENLSPGRHCVGQPYNPNPITHTNVIGECEPISNAYRAVWGDNGTSAYYSASGAQFAYVGNSRDAWCWGTTKGACEAGLFAYPYGADESLQSSTVACGVLAPLMVDTCVFDTSGECTLRSCSYKFTIGIPSPPPPPPVPPPTGNAALPRPMDNALADGGGFPVAVVIIAVAAVLVVGVGGGVAAYCYMAKKGAAKSTASV